MPFLARPRESPPPRRAGSSSHMDKPREAGASSPVSPPEPERPHGLGVVHLHHHRFVRALRRKRGIERSLFLRASAPSHPREVAHQPQPLEADHAHEGRSGSGQGAQRPSSDRKIELSRSTVERLASLDQSGVSTCQDSRVFHGEPPGTRPPVRIRACCNGRAEGRV